MADGRHHDLPCCCAGTLLRLLSVSEREKHAEILAVRHHVLVCNGNTRRDTWRATTYPPLPAPANLRPR
jgi:hypothetical protein